MRPRDWGRLWRRAVVVEQARPDPMPAHIAIDGARETGTVLVRIVADRRLRLAEDR